MKTTFHHIHITGAQHAPNHNLDFNRVLDDEERSIHIDSSIPNPNQGNKWQSHIGLGCSLRRTLTPMRIYTFPPDSFWITLADLTEADAFLVWLPWFDYFNNENVKEPVQRRLQETVAVGKPYALLVDVTVPRQLRTVNHVWFQDGVRRGSTSVAISLPPEQRARFVRPTDEEAAIVARELCPGGPHAVIDFDDPNVITRATVDALAWWCLLLAG